MQHDTRGEWGGVDTGSLIWNREWKMAAAHDNTDGGRKCQSLSDSNSFKTETPEKQRLNAQQEAPFLL